MTPVFFATSRYPDHPIRRAIAEAAAAHWRSLGITVTPHEGADQRQRFAHARDQARDHDQWFVIADDDCILRPRALSFSVAQAQRGPEWWTDCVDRLFRQHPALGMLAAIPVPEFPVTEMGRWNFAWRLPDDQREAWVAPTPHQSGNRAVGGIRFLRHAGVLDDLPAGNAWDYDYTLCDHLRARGWEVGYTLLLHCQHWGHGLSEVKKDDALTQALAIAYRPPPPGR